MASKEMTLSIERREKLGTTGANALRREGKIPAVLYGHGTTPQHIAFDMRTFDELLHHGGRTGVITLLMNGKKSETVLVRQVTRNPVTRGIQHVDLLRVSAHEAVRTTIPLTTAGVARGVKDFGGVMDVLVHDLEVEGPVDQLPDHLEVDVTDLGIHQHATAADVKLPKNFKLLTAPDTILVSVEASKTAQHLEEAASGVGAEQATPEVIGETPEAQ
ncbi:MAG: 50S ribosomal protein L25 [Candidatus Eremiobacteraeota bacterium]|nr:50S ribosomal protein L25 [Candidatus Eremiobacteraeota bacterium]